MYHTKQKTKKEKTKTEPIQSININYKHEKNQIMSCYVMNNKPFFEITEYIKIWIKKQ